MGQGYHEMRFFAAFAKVVVMAFENHGCGYGIVYRTCVDNADLNIVNRFMNNRSLGGKFVVDALMARMLKHGVIVLVYYYHFSQHYRLFCVNAIIFLMELAVTAKDVLG